ncbi:hypothetical protein AKO1_007862 [Acrasis kona]|uniref:Uncharacterized protein n=1 Tax=Acrasis kona TaxID=1008807 RepID=A0AAW2YP30_9EUKA
MAVDQKRRVRRVGLCVSCVCIGFAIATAIAVGVIGITTSQAPTGCAQPINDIMQIGSYQLIVDSWRKYIKVYHYGRNETVLATLKKRQWTVPYIYDLMDPNGISNSYVTSQTFQLGASLSSFDCSGTPIGYSIQAEVLSFRWTIKDTQSNIIAYTSQTGYVPVVYDVVDAKDPSIKYATLSRGELPWTDSWRLEVFKQLGSLDIRQYYFIMADTSFTGIH